MDRKWFIINRMHHVFRVFQISGFNKKLRFHRTTCQYSVALQSFTSHGVLLSVSYQSQLRSMHILYPEQTCFPIKSNPFAGKESAQTAV